MKQKYSNLLKTLAATSVSLSISTTANAGAWLNIEKEGAYKNDLDSFIDHFQDALEFMGDENAQNNNADPWVGARVYITWGEIPLAATNNDPSKIVYDFSGLVDILDAAYDGVSGKKYKVALTISDKYWDFHNKKTKQFSYTGGAVPELYTELIGGGDWPSTETEENSNGENVSVGKCYKEFGNKSIRLDSVTYTSSTLSKSCGKESGLSTRFAVGGSVTQSTQARKYGAVRWNPYIGGILDLTDASIDTSQYQGLWFDLWEQLANWEYQDGNTTRKLKNHPALHSIVTPESSIAGITHNEDQLAHIGYPGAEQYYVWQIAQAKKIAEYFDSTPVVNSVNWISERTGDQSGATYQNAIGDAFSALNNPSNNLQQRKYGWWAQDLRDDESYSSNYSYVDAVYPNQRKLDQPLRYAMITGDSFNHYGFNATQNMNAAQKQAAVNEVLTDANTNEMGQLAFRFWERKSDGTPKPIRQDENNVNDAIIKSIRNFSESQYSFLDDLSQFEANSDAYSINTAWVNDSDNKKDLRKIIVSFESAIGTLPESGEGLSVFVSGVHNGNAFENQPANIKFVEPHSDPTKLIINLKYHMFDSSQLQNKYELKNGDAITLKYNGLITGPVITSTDGAPLDSISKTVVNFIAP